MAAHAQNVFARNAHEFHRLVAGFGKCFHGLRLGKGRALAMLNACPDAFGSSNAAQRGPHQILDVDELHQPAAVAGKDDRAVRAQPVPEISLAIIWIASGP